MAVPRSKQVSEISVRVTDLFAHRTSAEAVTSTRTDEIIIVLCGPIGSPMHDVAETIKVLLEGKFGYASCNTIRMSKFIAQYAGHVDLKVPSDAGFKRINAQIDAGNRLRAKYGANVLA